MNCILCIGRLHKMDAERIWYIHKIYSRAGSNNYTDMPMVGTRKSVSTKNFVCCAAVFLVAAARASLNWISDIRLLDAARRCTPSDCVVGSGPAIFIVCWPHLMLTWYVCFALISTKCVRFWVLTVCAAKASLQQPVSHFIFFWGFVLAQYSLRLPVSPSIYQRIILQCLGFLYFVSVYSFCFLGNWDVGCCSGCCCWWCLPPLLLGMMLCVCFVLSLSLSFSGNAIGRQSACEHEQ